ncbi:MAG: rare lipoprotein, partial [Alphaproteobacteria bacterium]|nr:rare lipoprotein [Alphaproteobacteria bacterium]
VRVNDRGPYVGNRLIDLSIGTAKALDFYSKGLARVRVEYVGRAPLDGSDDKMLLATLREGSPAPAPSRVMIASAKPFLPQAPEEGQGRDRASMVLPAERPFTLGSQAQGLAAQQRAAQPPLAERSKPNASAKLPDATAREPSAVLARGQAAQPGVGFTASPSQGPAQGSLGLMSGRGLY